jgi:Sigma-70 factor, region 1.1
MASKIKVTPQKEELLEKDGPETPLLDLSEAAVNELIGSAKKRGYITHDQINALLSSEEVKSEQIEDILAKFSEMGVNVVDTKEAELDEEVATGEEASIEEERRVQVLVRDSRYLKLCQPMGTMAANWKKRRLRYVFWAALRTSHACLYTQQWACRR